jgi:uncharacterized protein YhfF
MWAAYTSELPPDHAHRFVTPDAFGFGGEPELADELAALVLAGKKRATTSLPMEYTSLDEPLPKPGDLSIVLRGDGTPVAIIETTEVTALPFESVTAEFAVIEGEGDSSLAYWREAHRDYFNAVCARLGGHFDVDTLVLYQVFQVLWKVAI